MNVAINRLQWYDLGPLEELPRRGARRVELGGIAIGVFRTALDEVFALEDSCPHKGGPLSQGIVHDNCVTCPLHNWVISLESGQAQGADSGSVQRVPVKLDRGRVQIGVRAAAVPRP